MQSSHFKLLVASWTGYPNRPLPSCDRAAAYLPDVWSFRPHARELLAVGAFYPQGINENKLEWLFPSIPNEDAILDKFRIPPPPHPPHTNTHHRLTPDPPPPKKPLFPHAQKIPPLISAPNFGTW